MGGLSKSVEIESGRKADIMVVDSTEDEILVEDVKLSLERASRTRMFNPRWIDGMLKHNYHGGKKITDRVENLLGMAATTGKVESWIFDDVAEKYLLDEEMRKRLMDNNQYAAVKMGELLIETERRGYWDAEPEKLRKLRDIILSMEGEIE